MTSPRLTAVLGTAPERPVHRPEFTRGLRRAELLVVLFISLAQSGVYAALDLLNDLFKKASLSAQTANLNGSYTDNHWIDLLYQLAGVGFGVVPVLLVAYLLHRDGETMRDIGFDGDDKARDLRRGTVIAACIGIPGLAFYLGVHAAGVNLTVIPESLPNVWWRDPVLFLSAAQNALIEEVVIVGYTMRRLDGLGWRDRNATITSALIRGSYHLYQGFGGFAANAFMGLVFVRLQRRWQRIVPLFVAHTIMDTVTFIGFAELAHRVSWIPT